MKNQLIKYFVLNQSVMYMLGAQDSDSEAEPELEDEEEEDEIPLEMEVCTTYSQTNGPIKILFK